MSLRRLLAPWTVMLTVATAASPSVLAQVANTFPPATASASAEVSFRQAVEAALARSATGRALDARQAEQHARRDAAGSLTPAPPSLALSHRSDRLGRNRGAREDEAELAVPLWMPGTRSAAAAVAQTESEVFDAGVTLARLKIAAEVREAVWALRLADAETQAATRRVEEARALADDVQRRTQAGDLARTDANQALSAVQQAQASQAEAQSRQRRAQQGYTSLSGLAQPPRQAETVPSDVPPLENHPQSVGAQRAVEAARARLQQVSRDTRDAPELALTLTRERGAFDERYGTTTRIGVRVPFGSDARNRPRITGANAELIELEAGASLERERLLAEVEASRVELEQARRIEQLATERGRLAADTQQLLVKAFRLGEIDLATRLRAENERFDADLALDRARLEAGRAASRLLQAHGLLP